VTVTVACMDGRSRQVIWKVPACGKTLVCVSPPLNLSPLGLLSWLVTAGPERLHGSTNGPAPQRRGARV
jgi:hypothetical protein